MSLTEKIGFDKILIKLNNYFLGNIGKSRISEIKPYRKTDELEKELCCVEEIKNIITNDIDFPVSYYFEIRELLRAIEIENTYFNVEQLVDFWKSFSTFQDLITFFKNEENKTKYPNLSEKTNNLKFYKVILENIKKILSKEGEIKDSASKELKQIRTEIYSKQSKISGIVRGAINEAAKSGYIEAETNSVIRNGKILIPVAASFKNKIAGIVQDYSDTGKTVYIEPLKSVELNNEIRDLIFAEKREIIRILTEFTDFLRPYIPEIIECYDFLSYIDFVYAKAKLAIDLESEKPKLSEKKIISLRYARHPLLLLSNRKAGKKVIPLDIEINEDKRIVLISGPNAGGKSIALKTVGLLQYMLQCGFFIPANPNSKLGLFDKIFVDIGDDQSIESDLSTYSSHLLNMKNIIEQSDENTLVLIDEFGSGTDPSIGGAIAESFLEELIEKGVRAVINTHYSNLKYFAAQNQGIENAAMLFDKENLKPLYVLETGNPGSSYAFEIAQNIGLPQKIINNAKNKTGKNAVNFDKIISDADYQTRQLKKELNDVRKLKKELINKVEAYRIEKEKIVEEKKKILKGKLSEISSLLEEANKSIEKTIFEIKSNKADKEITKKIRSDFEEKKKQILEKIKVEEESVKKEEEKIHQKKKKDKQKPITEIQTGDYVLYKKQNIRAKVEEIKDNTAMITFGNLRTFVKIDELQKIKVKYQNKEKIKVKIEMEKEESFIFGIDIRGKRGEEAIEKIAKYIDNAILSNASEIKILHGTGDGILRNLVRQYLKSLPNIEWFGDADIRLGGQGITLVRFK